MMKYKFAVTATTTFNSGQYYLSPKGDSAVIGDSVNSRIKSTKHNSNLKQ